MGRIGQWDVYELGSGSYVRTGRREKRKRQYLKNTDPDSGVSCADEQTSSKWASKLVKPTGGRCPGRSHAVAGVQPRMRRPVSWSMLLGGEHLAQTWGAGGRALWLALGASFFFLTRAAEMFAKTRTRAHE